VATSEKSEVRRRLRARRREIAAERDGAADGAALVAEVGALVRRVGLAAGATVLSYESVAGEPPTQALNAWLLGEGYRVLVPDTLPDLDLGWHELAPGDGTVRGLGLEAVGDADLVLAPGLAVDGRGTRLGQGGGCYDRALPRRRAGVPVLVLLHPGEREADDVLPREAHDVPVDGVVTADGIHWPDPA
jgi:5-formyltetrahydrofolate cyclo-ligase